MTERGLRGVANPSALFLSQHGEAVAGSAIVATLEGSRPLLVEIQALVDPVQGGMPQAAVGGPRSAAARRCCWRSCTATAASRPAATTCSSMPSAACGSTSPRPISPILLAVNSSLTGRPLPAKTLVFGEVGLAGEIRPVQRGQERIREAAKLGFSRCSSHDSTSRSKALTEMKINCVAPRRPGARAYCATETRCGPWSGRRSLAASVTHGLPAARAILRRPSLRRPPRARACVARRIEQRARPARGRRDGSRKRARRPRFARERDALQRHRPSVSARQLRQPDRVQQARRDAAREGRARASVTPGSPSTARRWRSCARCTASVSRKRSACR